MTSDSRIRGGNSRLQCQVCNTQYAKKEHLERHIRIHTGAKPFSCRICNKAFNRQDSLARHEKLHRRTSGATTRASAVTSLQVTTVETPAVETTDVESLNERPGSSTAVEMDFDSQLIWPDSEDLFQTIASFEDPAHLSISLAAFPLTATAVHTPPSITFGSPGSFDERRAVPSLSTDGEQAVQNLSQLVSAVSDSVTHEISTSSITSLFLDECLHMFFTRFNQSFPVLHRPTFVYKELTHPLLLNAIAIGSLYTGPEHVAKGEALWRLAHTAVATSWSTLITHRGPYDSCNGIQLVLTALLGQIYAALSRNRALRTTSQVFHALGFFWARHCGLEEMEPFDPRDVPSLDAPEAEKMHKWRMWVAKEIQRRAVLGHYILDGQIAAAAGSPTAVRHAANALTLPINEEAFQMESADEWITSLHSENASKSNFREVFAALFGVFDSQQLIQHSKFSLLVTLEGLQSFVSEIDSNVSYIVGVPPRHDVYRALVTVYEITMNHSQLSAIDRQEILLRWHAICLDAVADTRNICYNLCSRYSIKQTIFEGTTRGRKRNIDFMDWITTNTARNALLHAIAIVDIAEQQPQGRSQPIHLPLSLFSAALIYAVFSITGSALIDLPKTPDWKEVVLAGTWVAQREGWTSRNLFYEINSVRKLFSFISSQWGVAHEMKQLVDKWIALCH